MKNYQQKRKFSWQIEKRQMFSIEFSIRNDPCKLKNLINPMNFVKVSFNAITIYLNRVKWN